MSTPGTLRPNGHPHLALLPGKTLAAALGVAPASLSEAAREGWRCGGCDVAAWVVRSASGRAIGYAVPEALRHRLARAPVPAGSAPLGLSASPSARTGLLSEAAGPSETAEPGPLGPERDRLQAEVAELRQAMERLRREVAELRGAVQAVEGGRGVATGRLGGVSAAVLEGRPGLWEGARGNPGPGERSAEEARVEEAAFEVEPAAALEPEMAPAAWYARYGHRIEERRLPRSEAERKALALQVGQDGFTLLVWLQDAPRGLAELPQVETLRRVWAHHFERVGDARKRLRPPRDQPPAAERIESPYETEARFRRKRSTSWTGYLVHLSESCEAAFPPDHPVMTTPATVHEAQCTAAIHEALAAKELPPQEHLTDAAYALSHARGGGEAAARDSPGGPAGPA